MVLTNFECWASESCGTFDPLVANENRSTDPFNTRTVAACLSISHIASNGYYGFSALHASRNDDTQGDVNSKADVNDTDDGKFNAAVLVRKRTFDSNGGELPAFDSETAQMLGDECVCGVINKRRRYDDDLAP